VEGRSLEQKTELLKWLKRVMRGLDSPTDEHKMEEDAGDSAEFSAPSLAEQQHESGHHHHQQQLLGEDKEEYERLDEWREIRVRRKRKSDSGADMAKGGGEEGQTTKCEGSERPVRGRKNNTKLVVIEVGCGDSLHSLRIEAELMIRENPSGTIS
jgi:hypothetical protein